jgi:hypothetical protein
MGRDDDEFYEPILEMLRAELAKESAIFQKYAPLVINPSNDPGYTQAKEKFDAADRRIKMLEKEIAHIQAAMEPDYKSILDRLGIIWDKLTGDDEPDDSVAPGVRG